jgi:SAM-dependent methyltransferase
MSSIIETQCWPDWLNQTPVGRYLLDWEQQQLDSMVADIFGFHAIQLGLYELKGLRCNRMPQQWLGLNSGEQGMADLALDFTALPFPEQTLDLVVLPHTLELSHDPHATLREVYRVLRPEGRVIIIGFNPNSLWGWRQRRDQFFKRLGGRKIFLSDDIELIGYWRLRDWLRLLDFQIQGGRFGCYRPAVGSQDWLKRLAWMEKAGDRWWPILGSVYMIEAVKQVHGMRLLGPSWRLSRASAAGKAIPNAVPKTGKETFE